MFVPAPSIEVSDSFWKDFTVVFPAVSVGGVGQLAVDLILNNLPDKERIGFLYGNFCVPVVGSDPFQNKNASVQTICTSCEVFQSRSTKLVVIQQRSPFIKGQIPSFRRQFIQWMKICNFKHLIVLGSCSSHIQGDVDLTQTAQHILYLASRDNSSLEESVFGKLTWMKYNHTRPSLDIKESKNELYIPGGGIAKSLYEDCCNSNVSVIALMAFSNDGNGTADAMTITDGFNNLLPLISTAESFKQGSWKIPVSWKRLHNAAAISKIY